MPVTFRKEVVTDTWLIPARTGTRSLRKFPSRQRRRIRQIITSDEAVEKTWRILTNSENNNDLFSLCNKSEITLGALQRVLRILFHGQGRFQDQYGDIDIYQGLPALQEEHDLDSAIPQNDRLIRGLSGLYESRPFKTALFTATCQLQQTPK